MNYFDPYALIIDRTTVALRESEVVKAATAQWIEKAKLEHGDDFIPRFATCYEQLRQLPRRARRALQRQLARSYRRNNFLDEPSSRQARRTLQRKLAWSLAGTALLLALGQGIAMAATITVTTKNPNINPDGLCSLIEAIVNANNDAATHGECPAGSGADTIALPKGTHTLKAINNYSYGATGLPVITSEITIQGDGAKIRRQANAPAFRLMAVSNSGNLTLQDATLSGGYALYDFGGAVYNFGGTVNLQNSIISKNRATGLYYDYYGTYGGQGGGVFNIYGTVNIENSTLSRNKADDVGGAVYNSTGTVNIQNSTVSGNSAFFGGGLFNYNYGGGAFTIESSTIAKNKASFGGGVANFTGTLTIANSTISKNTAPRTAYCCSFSLGGGVYNRGILTIQDSTISGNIANNAGGVFNSRYCYYQCYSSAALTIDRSLITGNRAAIGPEIENFGTATADNFNLFGSNGDAGVYGFTPGLTDIVPVQGITVGKILGLLKNNGGLTKTHALKPGSPAVDAVPFDDPACTGTDQRGIDRPQGNGCDIGAFELGP